MISQRINRKLLCSRLLQNLEHHYYITQPDPDSYIYKCHVLCEPVTPMVDEFLDMFDAETLPLFQKNINYTLTVSKHLLTYYKQDLIWFQRTLAGLRNVRNAFTD